MLYTAYGKKNTDKTHIIFDMLKPIITTSEGKVSVEKLSKFIDFLNFFPF